MERVLAKIDPRTALSSFLLSLSLVAAYAIVGALVGAKILYDLSLPIWLLLFWAVMYTTGRHCIVMRATVQWLSEVCNNTKATGPKGYELCAYFEEKALGRPSTLVGALTYVVSVAYFLVFTLPGANWRLSELLYDKGFALGIPVTSVPLLVTSELLNWAFIRAVSTTAIWLALVNTRFLHRISHDLSMRFVTLDHWEMKPLTNSVWSISYSLGVAGLILLAWLQLLIVSVAGTGAINTTLAIAAAVAYGIFAFGISLCATSLVNKTLLSAKREVLSHIHDRLWEIYRCLEARSAKDLSDRNLKELNVEVLTLSKVEADIEKKKVFPFSAESALRLFFSPAISSGVVILREYFRSVTGL